ncbi:MAG: multicopper oxidase domain-containing protein [Dehalococcoidales bacterium]|nr:multicopper oxidase domain-containing protein [Dehalococcoidales bacterium]
MEKRIIPLRAVHENEIPIFHKHVCPPTFGGDPIDALTPTRHIARNLDSHVDTFIDLPDGTKIRMWVIEDPDDDTEARRSFPSKTIRTVEHDIVHARVGSSFNTHTIHWHGIEPTAMNDGVGKHSFEISGNFTYQFATNQAGTFLYHCHKNTALHFEMGLYGAFIVDCEKPDTPEAEGVPDPPYPDGGPGFIYAFNPPTHKVKYDVEALWVPDDIDTRWHELGHNAFMQKCDKDDPMAARNFSQDGFLSDFRPDVFSLSGEMKRIDDDTPFEKAAINCKVGQTVLLRFIDATYTVNEIRLGLPWTLVAEDGYPFGVLPRTRYSRPVNYEAGQPIRLTAAMRGDALIRPTTPGRFPCTIDFFHWITGKNLYTATTFINVE